MQLKPYEKLLTMTKEAIDASLASARSNSARKQAELEMAKIEERIATLETEVTAACSERELNFGRIIDKIDQIDLAKRRRDQFAKILREMFPGE